MEKALITGMGQEKQRNVIECFIVTRSNRILKTQWRHNKRTQELYEEVFNVQNYRNLSKKLSHENNRL